MSVKQISVFLENRAGRLWELCNKLGNNGINMRALSVGEAADFGIIRMIVDKPDKADEVLKQEGFMVAKTDVLAVEIPDVPGGLASVLAALKDAKMNVEYAYAFVARSSDKAIVSMRVEDTVTAEKVLLAAGFNSLSPQEVYLL